MTLLRSIALRGCRACRNVPVPCAQSSAKFIAFSGLGTASAIALQSRPSIACDSVSDDSKLARHQARESPQGSAKECGNDVPAQGEDGTRVPSSAKADAPISISEAVVEKKTGALRRCFALLGRNVFLLLLSLAVHTANVFCQLKRPLAEAQAAHSIGDAQEFHKTLWRAFILMALDQALNMLHSCLKDKALDGFQHTVERELVVASLRQDAEFFDVNDPSTLANRIHEDAVAVRTFVGNVSSGVSGLILSIGGGLSEIYALSPSLMFKMLAVSVPVCAYFSAALAVWLRARKQASRQREERSAGLVETFTNVRTVHCCSAEREEWNKYHTRSHAVNQAGRWERDTGRLLWYSAGLINNTLHLSLLYLGSRGVQEGSNSAADVAALFKQAYNLMRSTGHLIGLLQQLSQGMASAKSVVDLIDRVPAISANKGHSIDASDLVHDLTVDSVDFSYASRPEDKVLDSVSCRIPARKVTAVVGRSGSGKSTLGLLLQRVYDPDRGTFFLGDKDIRKIAPSSLRKGISYVEQEPRLFQGTIQENIKYGCSWAGEADVKHAADAAGVSEFVSRLPHRFETQLGKFGKGLSGGEKQRLAIARALLKKPQILVLDEATSALDVETEERLLANLAERVEGTTVVVITHRISTVKGASQILVMQQGRVVEAGTHESLCANAKSVYSSLARQGSH